MRFICYPRGKALAVAIYSSRLVQAKAVFAHYMVGNLTDDHAHKDVDDAIAMGLDAFALNIGYPQARHVYPALVSLFGYTEYLNTLGRNFKLFISMDLWAAGDVKHSDGTNVDAFGYGDLFDNFKKSPAYYKGPNGFPFVTTFSDGGMTNDSFLGWRKKVFNDQLYFVPDLDHTRGFDVSHPEWWKYWGPTFEGVAAWETAWLQRAGYGGRYIGDVGIDVDVIEGANKLPGTKAHGKTYMMPLSTIQYKNAYSTNSHYIGNIWSEQNTDSEPAKYVGSDKASHIAWQPLVSSWIVAYKNGATAKDQITLPPGTPSSIHFVGAVWYKTIMQGITCAGAAKPDGFLTAADKVAWAAISDGTPGRRIRYGSKMQDLIKGLNFDEWPVSTGAVRFEIIDSSNTVLQVANTGKCVYGDFCPDGIYNMNVEVVGFSTNITSDIKCLTSQPSSSSRPISIPTSTTTGFTPPSTTSVRK